MAPVGNKITLLGFCYLLRAERTMGIDNDDVFKMAEGGGIDDVGW